MAGLGIPMMMYYVCCTIHAILIIDIVFKTQFTAVNESYITDFGALKQQGDEKMGTLIEVLNTTNTTTSGGVGGSVAGQTFHFSTSFILLSIVTVLIMSL